MEKILDTIPTNLANQLVYDREMKLEILRLHGCILHMYTRTHPYDPHGCSACEEQQKVLLSMGYTSKKANE